MTVSSVIKDCLDNGIEQEASILGILKTVFEDIDINRLRNRIRSGIQYFKQKESPKVELKNSEFKISGIPPSQEHQDKLIEVLKLIKEKTDLKIPDIRWTCGKRCKASTNYIKLATRSWNISTLDQTYFIGVILHELVHSNGIRGHRNNFFNRLISVGIKCNLNLSKWFKREYTSGRRFYNTFVRPKIDRQVVESWENIK